MMQLVSLWLIHWIVNYQLESAIHHLNNWNQDFLKTILLIAHLNKQGVILE